MMWTLLFAISIAQGLFLVSLILIRGARNPLASRLICTMLVIMMLTNFGYLVARTELVNYIPQFFALPFGMMLLLGPLFYLYSKSVVENDFRWKHTYWLHFIPYLLQLLFNLPFLLAGKAFWAQFVNVFLAGNLLVRTDEKWIFALQDAQALIYLVLVFRWLRTARNKYGNAQYIISMSARLAWLLQFTYSFAAFILTVAVLLVFVLIRGYYNPVTNYIYTLVSSGIIYFVAYKLVLNPELISPDFAQKYKAYMQFVGDDGEKYLQKLKALMDDTKIFTDPDLKLALLAEKMGLPAHQVSKLINEKFGKSFNDYVNEHRVQEFITRISRDESQAYTIYGIALDVGFNSKSSFNTAFKKITGKTPSDYRK